MSTSTTQNSSIPSSTPSLTHSSSQNLSSYQQSAVSSASLISNSTHIRNGETFYAQMEKIVSIIKKHNVKRIVMITII